MANVELLSQQFLLGHGLFLKRSGILTTKDTKSTKFNKSDGFDYFQRPIT